MTVPPTLVQNEICTFTGGAYHVRSMNYEDCLSQGSNFRNFAFQVQMTILKGDAGGIIFRTSYLFYFSTVGGYTVSFPLVSGKTQSFKSGLNQSNLITVVAHGSNFYLYVNKQYVTQFRDSIYSAG